MCVVESGRRRAARGERACARERGHERSSQEWVVMCVHLCVWTSADVCVCAQAWACTRVRACGWVLFRSFVSLVQYQGFRETAS